MSFLNSNLFNSNIPSNFVKNFLLKKYFSHLKKKYKINKHFTDFLCEFFFSRNIFSLVNCTLNNIQFVLAPHWKTPRILCHYDGLGLPINPQLCLEFSIEDISHWSNFPFWVLSMTLDPQGLCSCLSLVFLTPIFPTPNTITSFPFYTFLLVESSWWQNLPHMCGTHQFWV